MNCNICGKKALDHSMRQVKSCLKKAGIEPPDNIFELMSLAGLSVAVNHRHNTIVYFGETLVVDDVEEALYKMCLLGTNVEKEKDEWVEEEEELFDFEEE
jgi:hypothetical protein